MLTEDDLLSRVMDLAEVHGWLRVHYRPAKTAKGYRTALQGDKGCPDIILARDGVVLLVELKAARRYPTREQRAWLTALGGHARLWRPSDWDEIKETLK